MGEKTLRMRIDDHRQLHVFRVARDTAMRLYELSRVFPREEQYSLTSQMRRCSRSVCANIAEAWQKRRYPQAFTSKLTDAAAEADETRCWIDFAVRCAFLDDAVAVPLDHACEEVVRMLVSMANHPGSWKTR